MTAPVRSIGVKFTAQGSEAVQAALAQVTAAAQTATQKIAQASQVQAQGWQRSVQAAERAALAEQAVRDRSVQQAMQAAARVAQSSVASATATSKAVSDKYGTVALSVAASFNQMAFAGKVTGEGIRNVMVQTATVAASVFGVGGPVVAAIAVTTLTVTNLFRNARTERLKMEEEAIAGLKRLANAGDLEGMRQRAVELQNGTPFNNFTDGIRAREARLAALGSPLELVGVDRKTGFNRAANERLELIRRERAELSPLLVEYARLLAMIRDFVPPATAPTTAPITITARGGAVVPRFEGTPSRAATLGRSSSVAGPGPDLSQLTRLSVPDPTPIATETRERLLEEFRKQQSAISIGIAETIAGGIAAGIAVAITSGSIADALQSLGQTVLASLGNIFAEIAAKAIMQATLMVKFMAFLTANPVVALAAAAAMLVLARSMGGSRSGAGGSSGSGSSSYAGAAASASGAAVTRLVYGNNSITTAAGMVPRTATQIVVIGPDDPRAQRAIVDILRKAEGRGMG